MVVYKVMAGWRTAAPDPRRRYQTGLEMSQEQCMRCNMQRSGTRSRCRKHKESRDRTEQEGGREGWWSAERGSTSLMTSRLSSSRVSSYTLLVACLLGVSSTRGAFEGRRLAAKGNGCAITLPKPARESQLRITSLLACWCMHRRDKSLFASTCLVSLQACPTCDFSAAVQ